MTRSAEEIEREVEASRADLDETIEALKSKMSPGQLIDELTKSFKGGGGELFGNLGAQVKENPMAVAMIGAGVAWLMMGKSDAQAAPGSASYPTTYSPTGGAASLDAGSGIDAIKDKAADALDAATSGVGAASDKIRDGASAAAAQVKDSVESLAAGASDIGQKARQTFLDTLDKEPFVIGALGLAVGVAIGASLPSTPIEDRTFGVARDNLIDEVKTRAGEGLDQARAAAAAAVEGVRASAEEEGLIEEGASVVDKAKTLVQAGVDAAKDRLDQQRNADGPAA